MTELLLVDAHVHVFAELRGMNAAGPTRGTGYGRALIGPQAVQVLPPLCEVTTHTAEMLIAHLDWAGVAQAVLLQGPFYGECNAYVAASLARYAQRLVGAAYLDPWSPDWRATFEQLFAEPVFRAVKLECSLAGGYCGIYPHARLDDPALSWLWHELERRALVLTLDLGAVGSRSYQTAAVRAIAERHPGLQIVIAHLAQPAPALAGDAELRRLWVEQIDLARLPNVAFDSSALPYYFAAEGYPFPSAERYLRLAIERIGPDKLLWGTDIPGLYSYATYPQLVALALAHTAFLSPEDRALVLGKNALRIYGRAA